MMSELPVVRIEDNVTPFTNNGVDYFGPFSIKLFRRTVKRWICLFTCLSVRAVHMEIVQSLDTQSCLDAVHRFIARRGKPKTVISDNGTNFVGAANELKAAFKELNHSEMQRNLAQNGIQWTFNPPAAPHFGGAWDYLVKSSKRAIFSILGKESLKEENLSTVIWIAEQLLNNRPLTAVSSDVEDLYTITPNHFLVGGANVSCPFSLFSDNNASYRKMFRRISEQLKALWKRWMSEYLPSLERRAKKRTDSGADIKVGDLVWMVDEKESYCNYPLARIQKLHEGDDKITRTATIKTAKGTYIRPLVKLITLDIDRI